MDTFYTKQSIQEMLIGAGEVIALKMFNIESSSPTLEYFGVYILSLNKDLHWGVVMAGSSGTSRIPPCLPGYLTDTVLEDKQV